MHPRDDPFFRHDRFPLPPPLGPMRDPFGSLPPEPFGRMGPPPPPPVLREPLYDLPNPLPRPLTPPPIPPPPVPDRKERARDMLRETMRDRDTFGLREKKDKQIDMEIIVVNKQQK